MYDERYAQVRNLALLLDTETLQLQAAADVRSG